MQAGIAASSSQPVLPLTTRSRRGPRRPPAPAATTIDFHRLFLESLGDVQTVVAAVARHHRMPRSEAEDFAADVYVRLLQDDYAVLRSFRGECGLRTFLTTVITRMYLDRRIAEWGKYRPSAASRRAGHTALMLERLVRRDRLTFDEACATLEINHRLQLDRDRLEKYYAVIARPLRPRTVGLDALADDACHPRTATLPASDMAVMIRRAGGVLRAALNTLPRDDRDLLKAYFQKGMSVADIARHGHLEQKALYRRVKRILTRLRQQIEPQLSWTEALATIGMGLWDETALLA